jgi:predicted RNase H-like HicB family nuclease
MQSRNSGDLCPNLTDVVETMKTFEEAMAFIQETLTESHEDSLRRLEADLRRQDWPEPDIERALIDFDRVARERQAECLKMAQSFIERRGETLQ